MAKIAKNDEFFEALPLLEKEKGIPMQYLIEKIEAAISIAIKRHLGRISAGKNPRRHHHRDQTRFRR